MGLEAMLDDLPKARTSAPVHDSRLAIPLAAMTAERVVNLYDLMDAAHEAREIHAMREQLGRLPIIDTNPRRNKGLKARKTNRYRPRFAPNTPAYCAVSNTPHVSAWSDPANNPCTAS